MQLYRFLLSVFLIKCITALFDSEQILNGLRLYLVSLDKSSTTSIYFTFIEKIKSFQVDINTVQVLCDNTIILQGNQLLQGRFRYRESRICSSLLSVNLSEVYNYHSERTTFTDGIPIKML